MANVVNIDAGTSIESQAKRWLIRMDGAEPLTDAEKKALKEWLGRSALHREVLTRLTRFWNQANILTALIAGVESARRDERERRRGASWIRTMVMATGAVFSGVILLYCGLQQGGGTVVRTYETVIGGQKTVLLSDGSSVELNTDSRVEVVYSRHMRRVRLLKGEALFSVTPDPNRAFEVYAADSIVRAIGTAFDVHLEGRTVDVTVAQGMVNIADAPSTSLAGDPNPAESAAVVSNLGRLSAAAVGSIVSGSGRMTVRQLTESELRRRMAWQDGYLAFSGEPLSEVVAQLNRYSSTRLVIGDPQLGSTAIGGRFRIGEVDAVLNLLSTTFRIRARRVNERTIWLESEPEH